MIVEFRTPSLGQMREDVPRLTEHFLQERRYLSVVGGITPEAFQ